MPQKDWEAVLLLVFDLILREMLQEGEERGLLHMRFCRHARECHSCDRGRLLASHDAQCVLACVSRVSHAWRCWTVAWGQRLGSASVHDSPREPHCNQGDASAEPRPGTDLQGQQDWWAGFGARHGGISELECLGTVALRHSGAGGGGAVGGGERRKAQDVHEDVHQDSHVLLAQASLPRAASMLHLAVGKGPHLQALRVLRLWDLDLRDSSLFALATLPLETLHAVRCRVESGEGLSIVAEQCGRLSELRLEHTQWLHAQDKCEAMVMFAAACSSLENLTLDGTALSAVALRVMGSRPIAASFAPLVRLHLKRGGISAGGEHVTEQTRLEAREGRGGSAKKAAGEKRGQFLAFLAPRARAVADLLLCDLSVAGEDLMVLAQGTGSVKHLTIEGVAVGSHEPIATLISKNSETLEEFAIGTEVSDLTLPLSERFSRLPSENLIHQGLWPHWYHLSLCWQLRSLSIETSSIPAQGIGAVLRGCKRLEIVSIRPVLGPPQGQSLTRTYMQIEIGNCVLRAIASAKSESIRTLQFGGDSICKATEEDFLQFCKEWPPTLRSLRISRFPNVRRESLSSVSLERLVGLNGLPCCFFDPSAAT